MGKVFTCITFPAVIIAGYDSFSHASGLLPLVLVGFAVDLCYLAMPLFFLRRESVENRAFAAVNCTAMSIGAFTLPFLQGYLGKEQLILVMLYDIGNGIMAFGGTLAAGQVVLGGRYQGWLRILVKCLFSSIAVWTYLLMLAIHSVGLRLPEELYAAANFIGNANPVLAMLVIGCTLDFSRKPGLFPRLGKLLGIHYGTAVAIAFFVYFFLPYSQTIRAIVTILLFSPLGSAALVHTETLGLDQEAAGLLNTTTIIIGIIVITSLIPIMTF